MFNYIILPGSNIVAQNLEGLFSIPDFIQFQKQIWDDRRYQKNMYTLIFLNTTGPLFLNEDFDLLSDFFENNLTFVSRKYAIVAHLTEQVTDCHILNSISRERNWEIQFKSFGYYYEAKHWLLMRD